MKFDVNMCTGCASCTNVCPYDALKMIEDAYGFEYPQVDYEKCHECRLCERVCPTKNRIGIVTLLGRNKNFGAVLQNYALQWYLSTQGYCVETLYDYVLGWNDFLEIIHKIFTRIFNIVGLNNRTLHKKEKLSINQSFFDEIFIGEKVDIRYVPSKIRYRYDVFIAGSDEVWKSPSKFYFLSFAKKNKISYAASIGRTTLDIDENFAKYPFTTKIKETVKIILRGNIKEQYRKRLEGYEFLSCREIGGAKLIEKEIGKKCEVVLDPTFLIEKKQWESVMKKPCDNLPANYILVYVFKKIDEVQHEKLLEFAGEQKKKVIDVHEDFGGFDQLDIKGFIYLINHADLIITDSFHGCCFSTIFNKQFFAFSNGRNVSDIYGKIGSLMTILNIENRFFDTYVDVSKLTSERIDYLKVNDVLVREISRSREYLDQSISQLLKSER